MGNKLEIRQKYTNGALKISGLIFSMADGLWSTNVSDGLYITVNHSCFKKEYLLKDYRDGSVFSFKTVHAAKTFAKRRKHGRTLEEHLRAEALLSFKERNGLSLKETAEEIGVSPRTLEAYFSGARAVPLGKI